jgi:hypothetical protein
MTLIFKTGYPARVVRVASVSLYRNFSKKILYGGKAYNPYNPYRLLPVGSPLSSTSFRQSIRGSPGTELRNWASVLTVTSVQLCVKRLLARPAWGLELLAYSPFCPGYWAYIGHFTNSLHPARLPKQSATCFCELGN